MLTTTHLSPGSPLVVGFSIRLPLRDSSGCLARTAPRKDVVKAQVTAPFFATGGTIGCIGRLVNILYRVFAETLPVVLCDALKPKSRGMLHAGIRCAEVPSFFRKNKRDIGARIAGGPELRSECVSLAPA